MSALVPGAGSTALVLGGGGSAGNARLIGVIAAATPAALLAAILDAPPLQRTGPL